MSANVSGLHAAQFKRASNAPQGLFSSLLIALDYGGGTMPPMETIGSRVKALRESQRLKQGELAGKLKISQSALSQIENGKTASLSGDVLAKLCAELTTTADFILHGSDTEAGFEAAMQIAEVKSIMTRLPPQARDTLVEQARILARAILPASTQDPFRTDRRERAVAVKTDRRKATQSS